jgi:hypothetical protein
MKATINGKRYNSEKCEVLASYDHYNHSNNYCGCTRLVRASDGKMLLLTRSNGQSFHVQNNFCECEDVTDFLSRADITDEQETRLVELGLLTIVE